MATCTNRSWIATLCLGAVWTVGVLPADADSPGDAEQWSVDFRYAPPWWQTSICLPDDWQKTLVAKDGGLLYDFGGEHAGFKTKITFMGVGRIEWVNQQLRSPRTAIVETTKRSGPIELIEETFAVPVPPGAETKYGGQRVHLERVGNKTGLPGWASPTTACD